MTTLTNHLNETTEFLKEKGVQQADFGLILGSGLGELANEITDAIAIPFSEIPHFSVSTVVGHAGQLVYGMLSGKKFWRCKDVFIIMKDIRCKRSLIPFV